MNSLGKIMGGFASFWILAIGLVLIFTAGPVIGCLTIIGIVGILCISAYINVTDRSRDAVEEAVRLRDVLEEIEEGVQLPPEYTGDPVDYYRALARTALLRDGDVNLEQVQEASRA